MERNNKAKSSKFAWGIFWLLIAGLILANYFGGFVQLGVWSIVIAALTLVILFHCIATLSFASLPIPIAALYYIFQKPLELPFVTFWTLALVALLITCGLHVLLPRRFSGIKYGVFVYDDGKKRRRRNRGGIEPPDAHIEEGDDDNNPYIDVHFGSFCRYLRSACLESAELACSFGALEVYFDHVQLGPNGAEAFVNCKLGSIEIYVPGHWRVIDEMSTSLGAVEISRRLQEAGADAPTLTLTGNVSLGSVEVKRI